MSALADAFSKGSTHRIVGGGFDGRKTLPAAGEVALLRLLRKVSLALGRSRTSYALIGAWALAALGRPRATLDLDFLVLTDTTGLNRLARHLALAERLDEAFLEANPMLRGGQVRLRGAGIGGRAGWWQPPCPDLVRAPVG